MSQPETCRFCGRPVERAQACAACLALLDHLIAWFKRRPPAVSMAEILGEAHRRLRREQQTAAAGGKA